MALTAAAMIVGAAVILFDPIFQGLAISLMAGEVASLLLSRMAVPVLYYMAKRHERSEPVPTAAPMEAAALVARRARRGSVMRATRLLRGDAEREPEQGEDHAVAEERAEVHPRNPGEHRPEGRHQVADMVPDAQRQQALLRRHAYLRCGPGRDEALDHPLPPLDGMKIDTIALAAAVPATET